MNIGCLDDIVQATNISATPNVAQLVGSQNGGTTVPTYIWSEYFDQHTIKTALKGIKQMHHFHYSHEFPGQVKVKNDTRRCYAKEKHLGCKKSARPRRTSD